MGDEGWIGRYLAERTLPKKTSSTCSGLRPARSTAAIGDLAWSGGVQTRSSDCSTFDDMRAQVNSTQARKGPGWTCQLKTSGLGRAKPNCWKPPIGVLAADTIYTAGREVMVVNLRFL